MKRRRRRHESTAYHEAGHAVAVFVLRLKIGRRGVSILLDKEHGILGDANIAAQLKGSAQTARPAREPKHESRLGR